MKTAENYEGIIITNTQSQGSMSLCSLSHIQLDALVYLQGVGGLQTNWNSTLGAQLTLQQMPRGIPKNPNICFGRMHLCRVLPIRTDAVYSQAFLTQALLKRVSIWVLCSITMARVGRDDAPSGARSYDILSLSFNDF